MVPWAQRSTGPISRLLLPFREAVWQVAWARSEERRFGKHTGLGPNPGLAGCEDLKENY